MSVWMTCRSIHSFFPLMLESIKQKKTCQHARVLDAFAFNLVAYIQHKNMPHRLEWSRATLALDQFVNNRSDIRTAAAVHGALLCCSLNLNLHIAFHSSHGISFVSQTFKYNHLLMLTELHPAPPQSQWLIPEPSDHSFLLPSLPSLCFWQAPLSKLPPQHQV